MPGQDPSDVCVFITAGPITKLFAGGGGGEWTTCAMIDDEPRPVWMSPLITHRWGVTVFMLTVFCMNRFEIFSEIFSLHHFEPAG